MPEPSSAGRLVTVGANRRRCPGSATGRPPGRPRAPGLVEAGPVEPGPDRWLLFHGATRAHDGSAVIGVATATEAGGAGSSIALARADRPDAPFVADARPLLTSGPAYGGPGHPTVGDLVPAPRPAPGAHPDHARLRRLLVDHGFLDPPGRVYRRSGGTV